MSGCCWSPVGGCLRSGCALAILSHDHRLSIHVTKVSDAGWDELTTLSTRLHETFVRKNFEQTIEAETVVSTSPNFQEYQAKVGSEMAHELLQFMTRSFSLATELIEWSPAISGGGHLLDQSWVSGKTPSNEDAFSLLFSLTTSGLMVVWKVELPMTKEKDVQLLTIKHLGEFQPTAISRIAAINDKTGAVAVGFRNGRVKLIRIDWSDVDAVDFIPFPTEAWPDSDGLAVSHLLWLTDSTLSCLVILKENYIIALQLGTDWSILQKAHVGGITCLGLTGCCKLDDSVLISSGDGLLLKASFTLEEEAGQLVIYPERVALNCSGSDFTHCGVAASPNGIYVVLAETYSISFDHLRNRDPLRLHLLPAKTVSQAFDILLESSPDSNGSHSLADYMDCLECIRQGVAYGDELPALLLQQVNARARWKEFSDFHLKVTRFATDLLMAPKISKTSESVTQLSSAKRLLDNLILWRHFKEKLVDWLREEEPWKKDLDKPDQDSNSRSKELCSLNLMCDWMDAIQPSLLDLQHIVEQVSSATISKVRHLLTQVDPNRKFERACRTCVVCGSETTIPMIVKSDSEDGGASVPGSAAALTASLATGSRATQVSCQANHRLPRCCLTLLPSGSIPYRKCPVCDAVSLDPLSPDLRQDDGILKFLSNKCIFCDSLFITC